MELKEAIEFRLKRENAFEGLMIDSETWQDAHKYHRDQHRLHLLAFHSTGVVGGLDVVANSPADLSVTVQPGLGVDPRGNYIVVSKAQKHQIKAKEQGTIYLVIQFREIPEGPYQPPEGGQPTRIMEAYKVLETDKLPAEPHLELARVDFDPSDGAVKNAKSRSRPGKNEIDLRHRREALPIAEAQSTQPPPPPPPAEEKKAEEKPVQAPTPGPVEPQRETITIRYAAMGDAGKGLHVTGLQNLAREIDLIYNLAVQLEVDRTLDTGLDGCDIVYMTGTGAFELTEKEQEALERFLDSGGAVLADGCAESEAGAKGVKEFGLAFNQLAGKLGRKLENVQRGHPLLQSAHVFSQVPDGAEQGIILAGGTMVYSGSDYGCAWAGGHADVPLPREVIRCSVEMAANVIKYRGKQ